MKALNPFKDAIIAKFARLRVHKTNFNGEREYLYDFTIKHNDFHREISIYAKNESEARLMLQKASFSPAKKALSETQTNDEN